jgi:hypothetical protein
MTYFVKLFRQNGAMSPSFFAQDKSAARPSLQQRDKAMLTYK